ncbi:MAG: hypothetical protein HY255_05095 [Betaproteobacteria bacterium]|nr:hypothetical protein [Betaproteobacteria bacterium]
MSLENGLGEAIRFVADQQRDDDEIRAGVENIFHKKGVFLEFLKIERDVLLKCGVDRATCDEMIDRINGARARIKRIKDVPDADSTIKAIEDLRDSACRMSKEFEWIFQQKKRDYELDKAFLKIYGVGLVIANLSALVLSWGISAAGSSASTGFGSLMVAWDGRLDDPGEEHPKN